MKNLSIRPVVIILLQITLTLSSCGESAKERMQRETIDSLENANYQKEKGYEDLQRYLYVIAEGLDSISIKERELLLNNGNIESRGLNRKRMQQNLAHVRDILSRHRERIAELEKQLENGNETSKQLQTIIAALRKQLDTKDKELAQLKADLEDNKKSISTLADQVKNLGEEKNEQAQTIQQQKETINEQNDKLNNAYIKIGKKSELKSLGLLSSGFLKKTKVDYSNIDLSLFQCIDIRSTKTINLPKKVKIHTTIPKDSYKIENNGAGGNTLIITNSAKFWSISNFLIIQID